MKETSMCAIWIDWPCLTQVEWAAWFQAIASVAAILVAIAVPAWQWRVAHREKLKEAKAQAISIAVQMLPHLQDIGRLLTEVISREVIENVGKDPKTLGPVAQQLLGLSAIAALSAHVRQLGRAQLYADQVVFNLYKAREMANYNGNTQRTWSPSQFYECLRNAQGAVTKALDVIDKMVEEQSRSAAQQRRT